MVNRVVLLCLLLTVLCVHFGQCGGIKIFGNRGGGSTIRKRPPIGGKRIVTTRKPPSWGGSRTKRPTTRSQPSWVGSRTNRPTTRSHPTTRTQQWNRGTESNGYKRTTTIPHPSTSNRLQTSTSSYSQNQQHMYPVTKGGSGSSSKTSTPRTGQGHGYPSTRGFSGAGTNRTYTTPAYSGNQHHMYPTTKRGPGSSYHDAVYDNRNHQNNYRPVYIPPTIYYSAPQHVYVTQYRNSGSRYSDLLTGLALYNMGRSQNHHHVHYYHDDYYNKRYNSPGRSGSSYSTPKETAVCKLKINNHNSIETVNVPCEIVSTFTKDGQKVKKQTTTNTTVCVTESTMQQNISHNNMSQITTTNKPVSSSTITATDAFFSPMEHTGSIDLERINPSANVFDLFNSDFFDSLVNKVQFNDTSAGNQNITTSNPIKTLSDPLLIQPNQTINVSNASMTQTEVLPPKQVDTQSSSFNATYVNVTKCTTKVETRTTDPLRVKGPAVNPSGLECIVEIETGNSLRQNKVDCKMLISYAKMPEPKRAKRSIMPSKSKLKSWLRRPPWWMAIFFAI